MAMRQQRGQLDTRALVVPTALFALHTFLLMATGVWHDYLQEDAGAGSFLYDMREMMLVVGFLAAAGLARWARRHPVRVRTAGVLLALMAVVFAGCVLAEQMVQLAGLRVFPMLVIALLVGCSGGMAYTLIAFQAAEVAKGAAGMDAGVSSRANLGSFRPLGVVVGIGGSLAVLVQYILQNQFSIGWGLPVLFVVCFAVLAYLLWLSLREASASIDGQGQSQGQGDVGNDGDFKGQGQIQGQNQSQDAAGVSAALVSASATASAQREPSGDEQGERSGTRKARVRNIGVTLVVTALLFSLFSFFAVVMVEAFSAFYFYEWTRLFIAAGYLLIGVAAFFGGRPAMSLAVTVAALFAILLLTQAVVLESTPAAPALFYTLLGAVIAWSGIGLMSLAPQSASPALVASSSRIVGSLMTVAGDLMVVQLAAQMSPTMILGIALVFLAVIVVLMVQSGFLIFPRHHATVQAGQWGAMPAGEFEEEAQLPSIEQRIQTVVAECGLTDRESEVLAALVTTEKTNQQIAESLEISRRQVQNHIARIYKKTGTQTRAGLVTYVNTGK